MSTIFKALILNATALALAAASVCSAAPVVTLPAGDTHGSLSTTNKLLPTTRFATDWYVKDTGVPGPTIMIVGGVHGNEPAGAEAAELIRNWPILKGKLVVVPRANVPGLAANKRVIPNLDTNLNNLNRNYPRAGKEEAPRGELATAIWNLALKCKPDWLLDLHEGYDFHQINDTSVGSSIIVYPDDKGKAAAKQMLAAVNADITNPELKFVERNMPIDGSLARAGGEHLHIPSMTLETTSKQPMARRVHQHEVMVRCLFQKLGMMSDPFPAERFVTTAETARTRTASAAGEAKNKEEHSAAEKFVADAGAEQTTFTVSGGEPGSANPLTRIALYKGPGTGGAGPPNLLQKLQHPPESMITSVTPEQIRDGVLTNYEVVIFAGGSASKQAEALGEKGRAAVRQFVGKGGGYIGICAGAYLATSGYSWGLNLINARTVSPKWQRGHGDVKVELTNSGKQILGDRSGTFNVHYANGPIVKPAALDDLPAMDVLAWFRTELAENGSPVGAMVNSPAVFSSQYKVGRVLCISPHPEQTKGLEEIVPHAVAWVAPKHELKKSAVHAE